MENIVVPNQESTATIEYELYKESLSIPENLDLKDLHRVIPDGFSHLISFDFDTERVGIAIEFDNASFGNTAVFIPYFFVNPKQFGCIVPKFFLEISSISMHRIDYSQFPSLFLNQNQMLYIVIKHRLLQLSEQKNPYVHLLRSDVTKLCDSISYDLSTGPNTNKKSKNSYIILSPWTLTSGSVEPYIKHPLGEYLPRSKRGADLDKPLMRSLSRDVDIQPGSESMASESTKLIISSYQRMFYKCAGYITAVKANSNGTLVSIAYSIFPNKPNIPSRFKTHILSDSYPVKDVEAPLFIEDQLDDNQIDETLLSAIVVFDEMDGESGRLLCGEIEASKMFCSRIVLIKHKVIFDLSDIEIVVGALYGPKGGKILIGKDQDSKPVYLETNYKIDITEISPVEMAEGHYLIKYVSSTRVESSRIISTTGLKGMTKPKAHLGVIRVMDSSAPNGNKQFPVDLITGMNAVKAGANTIHLAMAALSHKIDSKDVDILSSTDSEQINEFSTSLGKCLFINEFGDEKLVYAGLVQVKATEVSCTYSTLRPQKFSAEAGRYLRDNGYEYLAKKIWEEGVDKTQKEVVLELQKIITDDTGVFVSLDNIPIFTPDQLFGRNEGNIKIFYPEDCIDDLRPMFPHTTKLLDEDYNRGWYLDLRYRNGGLVRMPSAFLLNSLSSRLPDGTYYYPALLLYASQIIRLCIVPDPSTNIRSIGFLNNRELQPYDGRDSRNNRKVGEYLAACKSMLYKDNNSPMVAENKLIDCLMKPKLTGVGMKQVAEHRVPLNVVVVMCPRKYKYLFRAAGEYAVTNNKFSALCIRHPVLWLGQINGFEVWGPDQFRAHLGGPDGGSVALNDYLTGDYCTEVLLVNPFSALLSQSDCDGDLIPLCVVNDYRANEDIARLSSRSDITSKFSGCIQSIIPEEVSWIEDYKDGELEGNEKLDDVDGGYKLYSMPYRDGDFDTDSYVSHYTNSIVAKKEVGISTIHLWRIKTILECYQLATPEHYYAGIEKDLDHISSAYPRAVHMFVVRGIKHLQGGSSGFEPFKINNLTRGNQRLAIREMRQALKMPDSAIQLLYKVLHWAKSTGALLAITDYIRCFNSGESFSSSIERFLPLLSETYYGELLSCLHSIEDLSSGRIPTDGYQRPEHLNLRSEASPNDKNNSGEDGDLASSPASVPEATVINAGSSFIG